MDMSKYDKKLLMRFELYRLLHTPRGHIRSSNFSRGSNPLRTKYSTGDKAQKHKLRQF